MQSMCRYFEPALIKYCIYLDKATRCLLNFLNGDLKSGTQVYIKIKIIITASIRSTGNDENQQGGRSAHLRAALNPVNTESYWFGCKVFL